MTERDSLSIVLAGEAGQGINTVEKILVSIFKVCGYNVFSTKEYMSRVRGGINSISIRLSSKKVSAYSENTDILFCLSKGIPERLKDRINDDTLLVGEADNIKGDSIKEQQKAGAPLKEISEKLGGKIYINTVAAGIITGLLGIEENISKRQIEKIFDGKNEDIIFKNIKAVAEGADYGLKLKEKRELKYELGQGAETEEEIFINGSEAVALGALAGGCNFISSYPMSPSTGVLTFLAQNAKDFGVIAEQAEDEISAVNMAIGAWYAGARALVTTSGGGFALMQEGVSLAGMHESPLVIHLAQRPGPATGLPTRTEQGDLELALYSGHGEFPRIIFAPGSLEDAFYLTQKAFNLADKYQIPVFILTDQYLLDSYYNIPGLDMKKIQNKKHFIETVKDYKRYKYTDTGISPRGIPGNGDGLVCADSDEHGEEGYITEDMDVRVRMVDKRLKKADGIIDDSEEPELIGNPEFSILVLGWGSTYHVIKESLGNTGREDMAFLYFNQVYPLHPKIKDYMSRAEVTAIIENNATSQFSRLIKRETGKDMDKKLLKYNGMPFSVEEVTGFLKAL